MPYTYRLVRDTDPENPRVAHDNLGTIAYSPTARYFSEVFHVMDDAPGDCPMGDGCLVDTVYLHVFEYGSCDLFAISPDDLADNRRARFLGVVYVTKDAIRREYGWKRITSKRRDQVEQLLSAEVEEFSQYLSGDVWGYEILDASGDVDDSCWGFFGREYAEDMAQMECDAANRNLVDELAASFAMAS